MSSSAVGKALVVLGLALSLAGEAELIQYVSSSLGSFFLVYVSVGSSVLWFLFTLVFSRGALHCCGGWRARLWRRRASLRNDSMRSKLTSSSLQDDAERFVSFQTVASSADMHQLGDPGTHDSYDVSVRTFVLSSFPLTLLQLSSLYCYFLGLKYTFAASAVSIFNTSAVFVFFMALCNRGAPMAHSSRKFFATLAALGGVCLISFFTDGSNESPSPSTPTWVGEVYSLAAAVQLALYFVLYRRWIGEAPTDVVVLFNACQGTLTLLCAWPVFFVLKEVDVESFHLPESSETLYYLLGCVATTFAVNFLFTFGIALTGSPLFVTVGSMMSIPATAVFDWGLHGIVPTPLQGVGAVLVVAGLFGLEADVSCGRTEVPDYGAL